MSVLTSLNYEERFKHLNWQTAGNIKIPDIFFNRYKINHTAIDKLFGGDSGGLMPVVSFTIQGAKGAGKTTFLLQYLSALASQGIRVCYMSNEEIIYMLSLTCKRLNITNVPLVNMNDIDDIEKELLNRKIQVAILDSFPGLTTKSVQRKKQDYILRRIRELTSDFQNPIAIGIVLHLTKVGTFRGSSDLVYVTDINIELNISEKDGIREIKTTKNRTGETTCIELEMRENGYIFNSPEIFPIIQKDEHIETVILHLAKSVYFFNEIDIMNLCVSPVENILNILTKMVNDDKLEEVEVEDKKFWKEK